MTAMKNFSVHSTKSASELIQSFQNMSHYKSDASSSSDTHAHAKVGSEFLFRMIGAGVYNNYTAPVKVDIDSNGAEASVSLSSVPNVNVLVKDRVNEFFDRTFAEIEGSIRAAA